MKVIALESAFHDADAPDGERMKLLSKAKQKGARLKYYPKGVKFYRCSGGVDRPYTVKGKYEDVMDGKHGKMVYSRTISLKDEEGNVLNTIQEEHYKKASEKMS
jgi:hypothetical protein